MRRSTRVHGRRGITLIELLVVIGIMASLVMVGGGMMAPQISYFSQRAGVEEISGALRRAQALARSRGLPWNPAIMPTLAPTDANNVFYGLAIFRGRYNANTSQPSLPIGFSYSIFAQNDPVEGHRAMPNGSLDTLPVGDRAYVNPLPMDVHITRQYTKNGPLPPQPITDLAPGGVVRLVFYSTGELDSHTSAGACNSTLAALLRTDPLPLVTNDPGMANQGFASFSFDVVSPTVGYMRVRIRPGGTIETSAIVPTSDDLQTRTGLAF